MAAADLARVMEIAAGLPDAPQWPQSAYLKALDPESTPRRVALVAAEPEASDLLGFMMASLLPPTAELESIAVASDSQRHGIGRRLFDAMAGELRASGALEVVLEVRASNHAAHGFYRSIGFAKTGIRKAYYADPIEDAVLLRLRLG